MIVGIAPNVIAFLNNQTPFAELTGKPLGNYGTGEAGSYDEEIKHSNKEDWNNGKIRACC